jgi:hypothetical protein
MNFATITLCVASKRVFVAVVVYFVIDSVRKLLDTPSYTRRSSSLHCVGNSRFSLCLIKHHIIKKCGEV